MSPQNEFLEVLADTVETECSLKYPMSLKELKKEGGLYAELGNGFTQTTYYNKNRVIVMPVLFLCRDPDQKECGEQLARICQSLQSKTRYPQGVTFHWLNAEIEKEPGRIGRDEDGVYHYSCIINCMLYLN